MKAERKITVIAGCAVLIAVAATSCAPAEDPEGKTEMASHEQAQTIPLEGRKWVLVSYGDRSSPTTPIAAGKAVTAVFDSMKRRVGGNASCNQYFAEYSVDGNRIKIGGGGSTQMACLSPELAAQEQAYLAAIEKAETYQIDGDTLSISCADGTVLEFVEKSPASLESTEWVVTGFNNGKGGVVGALSGTELSAIFADGGVSGSAGCNRYRADYSRDGSSLDIGTAAVTKKMCLRPEGIMEQEVQFLSALSSAASFRIDGDTLELHREDGALAMRLSVQD